MAQKKSESKLEAIEFALRSFAHFDDGDERGRVAFLRSKCTDIPYLDIYFALPRENLQNIFLEKEQQLTGRNNFEIL